MPQGKRRKTHYQINKGVNQKTSQYTLSDAQVYDLYNMDFDKPNALSKRPGSTNMVTANTSGPVNSLFEFEKLGGASYLMAGTDTAMFEYAGGSLNPIATGFANGQPFDILAFTDRAFFCNGETFMGWTGESLYQYALAVPFITFDSSLGGGSNANTVFGLSNAITFNAVAFALTYTRTDGFESPLSEITQLTITGKNFFPPSRSVIDFSGGQEITHIPTSVSFINIYMAINSSELGFGGVENQIESLLTGSSFLIDKLDPIPTEAFRFITAVPNDATYVDFAVTDFDFADLIKTANPPPPYRFDPAATYTPRFIEVSQNRLFSFGFSAAPSSVIFSEIGQPERSQPEYNFEVRTNDSDVITGGRAYNDQMVFFKRNSFHKLVGDSADNYDLAEVSTEYGCVSNKAIVEYDNILLFLDEKGVVQFNGSDYQIISHPVEPVFRRMNINGAFQEAVGVHYDFRNQVWFGIPVDGSTKNNFTVVYDYLLNAWTFFDGFQPASFAMAKRDLTIDRLWYGDYSGNISHFSPSFYADNGSGITCLIDTKWDAPDGPNIENKFRRLFMDVNTVSGVTGTIDVEVYRNYDRDTVKATFSIYQNQFQTRREFGVGGKSVAFKFSHNSASLPLDLFGYTVHRRFLREV